jgi:outer membrane protein OmpA-like peptidoglycan-associated protein
MNIKLITGITVALAMAGCASTPVYYPALENARTMVQSAEADPNVAKYDPLDLEAAKQQLQLADAAALKHDKDALEQPAYLAAQTARLAKIKATAKADDARVAAGQVERDRIQLSARTREVNSAQRDADAAKREADAAKMARDQEAQKAAALQAEVDALKAKPTDRGLVLTLGDVLFDTGRAELSSGGARNLDGLVQFLTEHPDRHIEIDGYTDSVGTDSYNQDLSQRRADAVKSTLIARGIDPSRIVTQGFGKAFPVASNADSAGRQLNRRVEVVIGGDNGAPVARRSQSNLTMQ